MISSSARRETRELEAGVLDDRPTMILPSALIKSTRRLGVKLGPRPGYELVSNCMGILSCLQLYP